ncbi:MAG: hypothetical protein HYS18_06215 [Burkholderiales bacterium]|nr:hypothetical protein [Burkholderiales bacterium]
MEHAVKTKAQKILAAYERFAQGIAAIPDPKAQELYRVAAGVPRFVEHTKSKQPQVTSSQIASGLEQGLKEMPALVGAVEAQWRWAVAKAWHDAISSEYPGFLQIEAERLQKILARGKIRTEGEFHLVRYQIDVLEAQPELAAELQVLYALAETYEAPT